MASEIRWIVYDRYGNEIYLTEERWQHIIEPINHPEMLTCEDQLKETIRHGSRKQDPLNPSKYRYAAVFDRLSEDNTHIIAVVLFGLHLAEPGRLQSNNYIATAYQKEIG